MSKKHKKEKIRTPAKINLFFQKRSVIAFLFILVCLVGLPLRVQNIRLNGYISDDAWWHYRQINEVVQTGHRSNPDAHEFITLNRPMTYPPLFHYAVAYAYKILGRWTTLAYFTHYLNILEAILYLCLIFGIAYAITGDKLFSLLGMLAASCSYGVIIRARTAELMPFVFGDLFSLAAIWLYILVLKNPLGNGAPPGLKPGVPSLATYLSGQIHPRPEGRSFWPRKYKSVWLATGAGVLLGLAMLAWSGTVFIYLPMLVFAFFALILGRPRVSVAVASKLFLPSLGVFFVIALPWYLPLLVQYGLNPHSKEMSWFMQKFTVLHQVMPFNFYILTSGPSVFFIPVVLLNTFLRKDAVHRFLLLWIILAVIATYSGWRGYVAVVPILAAICFSIAASRMVRYFFKQESIWLSILFITLFLLTGGVGYYISNLRLKPLDPMNVNEIRTNAHNIRMLEFLKKNFPKAVTVDHITWVSEDAAVGDLRMVSGQYLEYMPPGSSEALKDISRIYLSDEETAYQICQKYGAELVIVRKNFLQLAQLSILFAPPEIKSEEFVRVIKEAPESPEVTISFTPKGTQTLLFAMLNRVPMTRFEPVYVDNDPAGPLPLLAAYRVKK